MRFAKTARAAVPRASRESTLIRVWSPFERQGTVCCAGFFEHLYRESDFEGGVPSGRRSVQ